jgi:hypothetical protein
VSINTDIDIDIDSIDPDEFKEVDETLSAQDADAFAKHAAAEAKKKKKVKRKARRKRYYRACTAGPCHGKPSHSVVRVIATLCEDTKTINFEEKHLIQPACEKHAKGMLQRFKGIGVPNVRMEALR